MYEYSAKYIRAKDADSVVLEVSLGFNIAITETFRLSGIDAPERFTAAGKLATKFVEDWFAAQKSVVIRSEKPLKREKWQRWLCRVSGDNSVLNDELLNAGHAEPYLVDLGS